MCSLIKKYVPIAASSCPIAIMTATPSVNPCTTLFGMNSRKSISRKTQIENATKPAQIEIQGRIPGPYSSEMASRIPLSAPVGPTIFSSELPNRAAVRPAQKAVTIPEITKR